MAALTAPARHTAHVRRTVAVTTTGRRHALRWWADAYLGALTRWSPGDARAMYGNTLLRRLGLAARVDLPDIASTVLAELDAPVTRLTAIATSTGQPRVVALLHTLGAMEAAR